MFNKKHWVAMWGNAMSITEHRPETYGKNLTLRYPIYCPFSGESIRISFDNYCGTEAVTISKATVWYGDNCYPVLFYGEKSCKIEAGKECCSDSLNLDIKAGEEILVSFYFEDFTQLRSSVVATGPFSTGTFAVGDMTETRNIPREVCNRTKIFYFLNNISILTESEKRAVVCYGDSITAQDWPDYLKLFIKDAAESLSSKSATKGFEPNVAIIRRAASGTRILRQYDNITYESYGLKGTNRFMHEVPTDGADTIIIQQGINDIIHPVGTDVNPFRPMSDLPTAQELIDGLKWYIGKARELGYKVYVGTLLPIEGWRTYAPFREDLKNAYNDWIRTTDLIDGCIDFDMALRDPANPKAFAKEYDSGDHLHPSALGYRKMAQEAMRVVLKEEN